MTNKLLFFVLLALCFSGCDMLETHPYDVHITGERELTNKNIQLIENKMQGKKTIRFAMISDTQRWYNSTEDVVKALNARGDIDFVIHGGDQSDFGVTKEFIWMRDIFNKFQMPYVCLLGNHDCLVQVKTHTEPFMEIPTSPSQPEMYALSASIPMRWNMIIRNRFPISIL